MKRILLFGGGRSATSFMEYILNNSLSEELQLVVVDQNKKLVEEKLSHFPHGVVHAFDIQDEERRIREISKSDLVVSLLPAHMHIIVARDCLYNGVNLLTASYHDQEMKNLDRHVRDKKLLFLGEMGLDPGIDHMSAMKMIHEIQDKGGKITKFISGTGGLIAPDSDDNPWHYKFTWNPRNVVMAGKGGARYLERNSVIQIPYRQLFKSLVSLDTPVGTFEMYPNRDSLMYQEVYGLDRIETLIRGTLRAPGFCEAWDALIRIGLTDDQPSLDLANLSYREFMLNLGISDSNDITKNMVGQFTKTSEIIEKINYLDLFSDNLIPLTTGSPADVLLSRLHHKWKLQPNDRDRVVMHHILVYENRENCVRIASTLDQIGENSVHTAMSKLVGLPLAIYTLKLLQGINHPLGVRIPVLPEIYLPVLQDLYHEGVTFKESETVEVI